MESSYHHCIGSSYLLVEATPFSKREEEETENKSFFNNCSTQKVTGEGGERMFFNNLKLIHLIMAREPPCLPLWPIPPYLSPQYLGGRCFRLLLQPARTSGDLVGYLP